MAVKDYFEMFPEDWELCKLDIEHQRHNMKDDMANIEGTHALKRALFAAPEKLSTMIALKLSDEERQSFKDKDNARWFADEFPQFRLTKNV